MTEQNELTHADLLLEIRTNHSDTSGKLDLINHRLGETEKQIAENGARGKEALRSVNELKGQINAGKTAIRLLAWIGGGLLAAWGGFVAYAKTFGPQ